ncbi:uncharacterized protein L969DRAFT_53296 [Mixia osmundae IAM 14324]|uniref:Uncharacterized protein n=1 Tax=Mixia osmundae (strain CBS 9802 / IAM 14324 / JCM 22182 / KY 12970) TaxID=764103 RepID=G7DWK9_MIXOS|nr:uncharacterized protein L969DRAFT_53296 [Mixia osmundae IAM 14324]KEI37370.1 hypothetical protein L969DRAFT_53296 [Mixia osmundae IAM 14324]GAA94969.1 hypothetical protein E5Q_01624 [Mixia osmundae IAM 14324]
MIRMLGVRTPVRVLTQSLAQRCHSSGPKGSPHASTSGGSAPLSESTQAPGQAPAVDELPNTANEIEAPAQPGPGGIPPRATPIHFQKDAKQTGEQGIPEGADKDAS